jgi:hypothetical protein
MGKLLGKKGVDDFCRVTGEFERRTDRELGLHILAPKRVAVRKRTNPSVEPPNQTGLLEGNQGSHAETGQQTGEEFSGVLSAGRPLEQKRVTARPIRTYYARQTTTCVGAIRRRRYSQPLVESW